MDKLKIGLLPLYIEMYDRDMPQIRPGINGFRQTIIQALEMRGLEVEAAPVCRVRQEFVEAINFFKEQEVDAVVTLHLAYSPSLESSEILAATKLPLIVLDTTPAYNFSPAQDVEEINYNHGIHGVQDMCNLLKRNKKEFFLEAGHWEKSDVLDRVAGCVRAVKIAQQLRKARVGRIGQPFEGMGDFLVSAETLHSTIGIETVIYDPNAGRALIQAVSDIEIDAEMAEDREKFYVNGLDNTVHRRSTASNLAVRKWLEKEKLTAFTVNFLAVDSKSGLTCMPFLEAGKSMARGIGYAGEGDVLTAALVGALASVYCDTSFTEMFCPDWENDSIFISHMGEMNINLSAEKPRLAEEDFPYTDAENPVLAYGRFKEGKAVLVNLAPAADNTYTLIIAPLQVLGVEQEDRMKNSIHGWIRPDMPVSEFLTAYSEAGGTHHSALVYGDVSGEIARFGKMMGWDVIKI